MNCPYSEKCWRLSYSKYLLDIGYITPPDRFELLLNGYATAEMMPKAGLFAECFPSKSEYEYVNICPELQSDTCINCHEYRKETKRLNNIKATKEKNKQFKYEGNKRLYISRETRQKIAKKHRYKCVYCNRAQNQFDATGKKVRTVVDHIIPLSKGGLHIESNFTLACSDCNRKKSDHIDGWKEGCMIGHYDVVSV